MTVRNRVLLIAAGWLSAVTLLHLWLNTRAFDFDSGPAGEKFSVGFLPVT